MYYYYERVFWVIKNTQHVNINVKTIHIYIYIYIYIVSHFIYIYIQKAGIAQT